MSSMDLVFRLGPKPSPGPGTDESSSAIADFVAEVVAVFPDLTAENTTESPWEAPIHHDTAGMIVKISWERSKEVMAVLLPIAARHGLTVATLGQQLIRGRPLGGSGAFRVEHEAGRARPDPSIALLWSMLGELGPDDRFLILTRLSRPGGEHYAQVYFQHPGHYDVEHREGSAAEHYAAVAPDVSIAHAVLIGWAEQRPGWRDTLAWRRLESDS